MGISRATLLAHCNPLHHRPFEAVIIIANKKQARLITDATNVPPTVSCMHNFCAGALLCTLVSSAYLLGFLRVKAS